MTSAMRIVGFLQNLLLKILHPLYWLLAKTVRNVPLEPVKRPLLLMSATKLAAKIRKGELTCEEVVSEYIYQSKTVNKLLNAVVEERFADALKEALEVDKIIASKTRTMKQLEEETPLLGVPITVKESCKVKGMSYAVGCKVREGVRADSDGAAVALLRQAGAIPILVTNTPELCMAHETHNLVTGLTRNPYNQRRTTGGSSGGEAALISSASSVIGVGSDLVGSILCPSFFCGIFGHRPTPKVISVEGHFPGGDHEGLKEHLTVGPMTRYAEDLKLMVEVMAGNNKNSLHLQNKVDLKSLKVYYILELKNSFGLPAVDKEVKQAIIDTANHFTSTYDCFCQEARFEELCEATEISNAVLFNIKDAPDSFKLMGQERPANLVAEYFKSLIGVSAYSTSPLLLEMLRTSNRKTNKETNDLLIKKSRSLKNKIVETLGEDGVIICPVYSTAAHYHYQSLVRSVHMTFCALVSSLGLPATSVPIRLNTSGLPIGLQVVAGPHQDRLCLAVAEELEKKFGGWVPPTC